MGMGLSCSRVGLMGNVGHLAAGGKASACAKPPDKAAHEIMPGLELRRRDIFVGLMRLRDVAGAADRR
jgi:hypothetical protein